MPKKVEQIDACHNIVMDYDQPLTNSKIFEILNEKLIGNIEKINISGHSVFIYTNKQNKKIVLLTKCITYLGHPHPKYKKRIQLSDWYKTFTLANKNLDIRYLGIYQYNGLIIFVDFDKTNYLKGKSHNSSAYIYINDLYHALTNKVFQKTDAKGNIITSISGRYLKTYLDGNKKTNDLFDVFSQFNKEFYWNKWISAQNAIKLMYQKNWKQWRQTEWAGWFLEFIFSSFIKSNNYENIIIYTAFANKSHNKNELDFDLFFPKDNFQGDLKASDMEHKEAPGNDQESILETLNQYGKFWYVIYEHDTIKDKDVEGNPATNFRTKFISQIDNIKEKKNSNLNRMKNSVRFRKMMILELNRINYHQLLTAFNQGRQQSGQARNPKFNINKKSKDIENFVVYRYMA